MNKSKIKQKSLFGTYILALCIAVFGSIFVCGGWIIIKEGINRQIKTHQIIKEGQSTHGIVIGFEESRSESQRKASKARIASRTYISVAKFWVSGKDYIVKSAVSSNPPEYNINDTVPVLYNKNNPQESIINNRANFYGGNLLLVLTGSVFALVGILIAKSGMRIIITGAQLQHRGKEIQAKIIKIEKKTDEQGDFWEIIAEWTDFRTGINYKFVSDALECDPKTKLKNELTVLVDEHDPKNYYVDLSNIV